MGGKGGRPGLGRDIEFAPIRRAPGAAPARTPDRAVGARAAASAGRAGNGPSRRAAPAPRLSRAPEGPPPPPPSQPSAALVPAQPVRKRTSKRPPRRQRCARRGGGVQSGANAAARTQGDAKARRTWGGTKTGGYRQKPTRPAL